MDLNLMSLLILFLALPFTSSQTFPSPDTLCNATPHPSFCKSTFPSNFSGSVQTYARTALRKSLTSTLSYLGSVERYINGHTTSPTTLPTLEDCRYLISSNKDYLYEAINQINDMDDLDDHKSVDLHTMLSAVLTNHQTCIDELVSINLPQNIVDDLVTPSTNRTMGLSVSLALFKHGYVDRGSKGKGKGKGMRRLSGNEPRQLASRENLLPSLMSVKYRRFFGRKMIEVPSYVNNTSVNVSNIVVVNPDGSGNYTNISDAVNNSPSNVKTTNRYYVIYVVAGLYEEYVTIPSNKKYLMMIGDGINQTIITGNRSVADGWTTFNSATYITTGVGFVGVNMTIRNTAGPSKGQAVALRSGADLSVFYYCSFEAYQDTLYTHSLRQFYKNCDIYGTVDFIFGNAAVVLQDCNIYPRLPLKGQFNALTAQGRTDINQNTGTSIQNCHIQATPDLVSANYTVKSYLGRPWKEFSRTVYMQSYMDSVIDPAGWHIWTGDFALSTLYYAEFNNSGLGSDLTNRVNWTGYHIINETDAVNFTVSNFLVGQYWLNVTGVPYTSGLM